MAGRLRPLSIRNALRFGFGMLASLWTVNPRREAAPMAETRAGGSSMARRATIDVTVRCERCDYRTRLRRGTYSDNEVVSCVCPGCWTPLAAVITLSAEEIEEPDWYWHIKQAG